MEQSSSHITQVAPKVRLPKKLNKELLVLGKRSKLIKYKIALSRTTEVKTSMRTVD